MRLLALIGLLLSGTILSAQSLKVTAEIEQPDILPGDQVWFHLKAEHDAGMHLIWPEWSDTITKSIEILQVTPVSTHKGKEGLVVQSQDLLITSFDSGRHILPPAAWQVQIDSLRDTVYSNPVSLWVQSIPVDTEQEPKDIKPILEMPVTFREVLPWVLLATLLAGLGYLVFLWRRKRMQQGGKAGNGPVLPPHERALKELEELQAAKLWQNGRAKEYYTLLTDILREYMEGQMGINAMEMTSEEVIGSLKKQEVVGSDWLTRMRALFSCADLVKFAKYNPLPSDNVLFIREAFQFVRDTTPEAEPVLAMDTDIESQVPAQGTQTKGRAES